MKQALVIENGEKRDIPKSLISYLDKNDYEWTHLNVQESFWPKNRISTLQFFSNLPNNHTIICDTVFDGFLQLELFIQLFDSLKDKHFNIRIRHGCLCDDIIKYYDGRTSELTPDEIEDALDNASDEETYEAAKEKLIQFKQSMNNKLESILQSHDVYWIPHYDEDVKLDSIETIRKNCIE